MERFEVLPGGGGGIRQAEMGEGVAHQQIAVLVIDARLRNANPGQQKCSPAPMPPL